MTQRSALGNNAAIMKTIILIFTLAIAAAGQQTVSCLTHDGNGWIVPLSAAATPFKIQAGGQYVVPVSMPVAGRCVGSFAAFDDRDDLAVAVTNAASKYIPPVKSDIEILVLDTAGLQRRNADQSYVNYWTSGRSIGGWFDIQLNAGVYFFVISNKHSYLARKTVLFSLGERPPAKRPAP